MKKLRAKMASQFRRDGILMWLLGEVKITLRWREKNSFAVYDLCRNLSFIPPRLILKDRL